MHFDDHEGLQPKPLRLMGRSLRGTLTRTKTTGSGKRVEELYLHVDCNAWLVHSEWLDVGFALWQGVGPSRDDFLVLPTCDMQNVIHLEAQYSDCQGMSRALVERLVDDKGQLLVTGKGASAWWAEHSDRATLPSLAACIDTLPDSWLDALGRWATSMSAGYVRTMLHRVGFIQSEVAKRIRTNLLSLSRIGEDDLMAQWATYLVNLGVDQETALAQASAVATAAGVVCGTSDVVPSEGQALEARVGKPAPGHFASSIPDSELAALVSHIDLVPAPPTGRLPFAARGGRQ